MQYGSAPLNQVLIAEVGHRDKRAVAPGVIHTVVEYSEDWPFYDHGSHGPDSGPNFFQAQMHSTKVYFAGCRECSLKTGTDDAEPERGRSRPNLSQ